MSLAQQPGLSCPVQVKVLASDDVVKTLLQAAQGFDLVVLPSFRRRNRSGSLSFSDTTTRLLERLTGSLILVGEPL